MVLITQLEYRFLCNKKCKKYDKNDCFVEISDKEYEELEKLRTNEINMGKLEKAKKVSKNSKFIKIFDFLSDSDGFITGKSLEKYDKIDGNIFELLNIDKIDRDLFMRLFENK